MNLVVTRQTGIRVLMGLLSVLMGCSDDIVEPGASGVAGGRIVGTVRSGGVPVDAVVRAVRIPEKPGDVAEFDIAIEWDGTRSTFQQDLPAGRYVAELRFQRYNIAYGYSADGLRSGDAPPDTLIVDAQHSPVTVDFELATMRVRLDVSREMDGADGIVELHKRGAPSESGKSYLSEAWARIAGGRLDVTFPGVLPGAYKVEFEIGPATPRCCSPSGDERFWAPGVRDSIAAPWTEVLADRRVDVTMQISHGPARIRGEIVGAWLDLGIPKRPSVALVTPESTIVHGPQGTDTDGSFELRQSIPGPVRILVEHDGVQQWVGGRRFSDAQTFQLEPWQSVTGVQLVESGLQLDIQADDFSSTDFRLYDASTLSVAFEWLSQYAGAAPLTMPNLAPGTYLLHIEPRTPGTTSWAPQWYDRASVPALATPIRIEHPGHVVAVSVVLEAGGSIGGTVRDYEGVTGNYFIYITRADDPKRWGSTFAYSGRPEYRFTGIPDGEWKIGVWRREPGHDLFAEPPQGTVWFPGVLDWSAATPISILDATDVVGVDIEIPAPVQ